MWKRTEDWWLNERQNVRKDLDFNTCCRPDNFLLLLHLTFAIDIDRRAECSPCDPCRLDNCWLPKDPIRGCTASKIRRELAVHPKSSCTDPIWTHIATMFGPQLSMELWRYETPSTIPGLFQVRTVPELGRSRMPESEMIVKRTKMRCGASSFKMCLNRVLCIFLVDLGVDPKRNDRLRRWKPLIMIPVPWQKHIYMSC